MFGRRDIATNDISKVVLDLNLIVRVGMPKNQKPLLSTSISERLSSMLQRLSEQPILVSILPILDVRKWT